MKKDKLEYLVVTGTILGKRGHLGEEECYSQMNLQSGQIVTTF